MQKKIIALAVAATFFVTACGNDHSDAKQLPAQSAAAAPVQQAAAAAPVQQAAAAAPAQPIVVQQSAPAQSGASTGDMLMAGAVGYLMAGGGQRPAAAAPAVAPQPTTVINKTYVTKQYVQETPKPAVAPVAAPAKPAVPRYSAPAPAPKPTTSYSASKPMSYSGGSSFSSSSRSFSSGRR